MFMDIKDYQQKVADILKCDYFPQEDGYTLRTETVRKNNNINLHAICIQENNSNIAPTFYIEDYLRNNYEPEAVAHSIFQNYQKHKQEKIELASIDFNKLYDFDAVKDIVCFKVINRQRNSEMANDCPVININDDLMLAFYLQIKDDATCLIQNKMCAAWELDKPTETLYKHAKENTERLHPAKFQSMFAIMHGIMPEDMCAEIESSSDVPMFVLSNKENIHGASVMFYRDGTLLDDYIAEFKSISPNFQGVYILPSSTHEIIIIPDDTAINIDENALADMVREVNRTQLSESDFLSDNIFYYRTGQPIKQLTFSDKQIVR